MTFKTPKPVENDPDFMKTTIRIYKKLQTRLKHAVIDLPVEGSDERATMDWFMQEAIAQALDFVERKGDEMVLAAQEIAVIGSEKTRRNVRQALLNGLEEARATEERRTKQPGGRES